MARLWASGFELASNDEFLVPAGISSGNYVTTTKRSGDYSGRIFSMSSGSQKAFGNTVSGGGTADTYQSAYFNFVTYPSVESTIISFHAGGSARAYITIDSSGALRLYDEDGVIGSASSAVGTGAWVKIDLRMNNTPSAGSHVVEARLNDSVFATSSTRSLSTGFDRVYVGGNINSEANSAGEWFVDDWKVNDSSGGSQNTYPVNGKITRVLVDSAGDNAQFSRGGTDSGSNYGQVDEISPNNDTDYVESNTLDQIDDYGLASTGIGASDTIIMVNVGFRQRGGSTSANASYRLRFKTSSGGTVAESDALTPSNNAWRTNRSSATPVIYRHIVYHDPGTANDLTPAMLDGSQIGLRISTGNTNTAIISALWLDLEYQEADSPEHQSNFFAFF